jgi:hypothetical protein
MVRDLGLLQAKKTRKGPFSVQKGVKLPTITTNKTIYQCKKHPSIEKGSKGRA